MTRETMVCILVVGVAALTFGFCLRPRTKEKTTLVGAVLALTHISTWATWMAGIQTAALGGLGWLIFNDKPKGPKDMDDIQAFFALGAFICLGFGLFMAAWVLSSLPSLAIRLYTESSNEPTPENDVYEKTLFGFGRVRLGYVMGLLHWLWGFGLLFLGIHIWRTILKRP